MAKRNLNLMIANPLMKLLLRSPWHWVASNQILLITVTGRKSGKQYTTPVNYIREDDTLTVISHRHRTWWRNLRGGAPVIVYVRGKKLKATGQVFEEKTAVAERFYKYLQAFPQFAEPLGVGLDAEKQPIRADVETSAEGKVMVEIHLQE